MRVVILGCGRMGSMLASQLSSAGHQVAIIDQNGSQFQRISPEYQGKKIVGNGTEQDILRRAGIEKADVFVAITQGDNRNILASQVAKHIFNVPHVFTRVKDPGRAECFAHSGLNTFCTTLLSVSYIQGALLGDTANLLEQER